MKKVLALSGVVVSAAGLLADPIPERPQLYLPPPALTGTTLVRPPESPGSPTPTQLLHPDRSTSLLPSRPGSGSGGLDPEVAALQQDMARLKRERESLAAEREKTSKMPPATSSEEEAEAARLRARIAELLVKVEAKKAKEGKRPTDQAALPSRPVSPSKLDILSTPSPAAVRSAEALQVAQAQFHSDQFDAVLQTIRRVDSQTLSKEDCLLVQYLTAGCLRNLGRLDEAVPLYRTVVDSRGDEALVESASWQLTAIDARRNMLRELAEIRERRTAR